MRYRILENVNIAANPQGSKHRELKKGVIYDDIPEDKVIALKADKRNKWLEEVPLDEIEKKLDPAVYETKVITADETEKKEDEKAGWTQPVHYRVGRKPKK